MRLAIWATPGARSSALAGVADGCLRVRLAAPAHEGRANAELVRFLAEALGVSRSDVELRSGAGARRKVVHVRGMSVAAAATLLDVEED